MHDRQSATSTVGMHFDLLEFTYVDIWVFGFVSSPTSRSVHAQAFRRAYMIHAKRTSGGFQSARNSTDITQPEWARWEILTLLWMITDHRTSYCLVSSLFGVAEGLSAPADQYAPIAFMRIVQECILSEMISRLRPARRVKRPNQAMMFHASDHWWSKVSLLDRGITRGRLSWL